MIIIYQRDPGETKYKAIAQWEDGEWIEGEDEVSHLPDQYEASHILEHFDGAGTRRAVEFEDGADFPALLQPNTDEPASVDFEQNNWLARGREEMDQ